METLLTPPADPQINSSSLPDANQVGDQAMKPTPKAILPEIRVTDECLKNMTARSLTALESHNEFTQLYVRSDLLVRLRVGTNWSAKIEVVTDSALRGLLERSATYSKQVGKNLGPALPPMSVVKDIQSLAHWPFPSLDAVIEIPVLRSDGTVLERSGYDPSTHLLYWPGKGLQIPPHSGTSITGSVAGSIEPHS